ncbi:MAG: hypothetical protein Q4E21_00035 [Clostridia bacterium]|nr:hypothetical protein [Clostridia bacterium]
MKKDDVNACTNWTETYHFWRNFAAATVLFILYYIAVFALLGGVFSAFQSTASLLLGGVAVAVAVLFAACLLGGFEIDGDDYIFPILLAGVAVFVIALAADRIYPDSLAILGVGAVYYGAIAEAAGASMPIVIGASLVSALIPPLSVFSGFLLKRRIKQ